MTFCLKTVASASAWFPGLSPALQISDSCLQVTLPGIASLLPVDVGLARVPMSHESVPHNKPLPRGSCCFCFSGELSLIREALKDVALHPLSFNPPALFRSAGLFSGYQFLNQFSGWAFLWCLPLPWWQPDSELQRERNLDHRPLEKLPSENPSPPRTSLCIPLPTLPWPVH